MPIPPEARADPTPLTTAQLLREIEGLQSVIYARLDGMDRAAIILDANVNRVPSLLDREVRQIKDLLDERFKGVQKQFDERDVRSTASEDAAKVAVNAALQAQKEAAGAQNDSNAAAITKSEAATMKQIDGIIALLTAMGKATDEKISDLKGRIDRGEGAQRGNVEIRTDRRGDLGNWIAIALAMIAMFTLLYHR